MTYQFHTISKQVLGDLQTPVSIYLKVRDIYPVCRLLPCARWEVSGLTGEQLL